MGTRPWATVDGYILVWPGLQAIPFEMHTSVIFWVRVCVTGGIGVGGGLECV